MHSMHSHFAHEGHARRVLGLSRRGPWHGGGPFGVRRPLRFLTHKLALDDDQVRQLAVVLDDLKTERAQAHVDDRRATKLYAEAVASERLDRPKAELAAQQRVEATARVQSAVVTALEQLTGILDADQRERLALLIRTGPLTL